MSSTYPELVQNQLRLLEEEHQAGLIDESDAEAIRGFAAHDVADQGSDTTVKNHLVYLRTTASRSLSHSQTPLVDLDVPGIVKLLDTFKNGSHEDVKDSGIGVSNHQKTLRVFFRWADLGVDPEDVEIDKEEGRNLRPDDLLFQSDVDTMMRGLLNLRDRALFTMYLATGQRLDALRTLRLRHVSMDGRTMDVTLNEEEGRLKGANGKKPLLWSKHYVREWYESHPYQGDDDAALFCPLPDGRGMHGVPDGEERDPLNSQTIRDIFYRAADRAGLEKDVYPHLLRATAITRMVLEGLNEQKIKRIVGWSPDSSQFGTYVALADQLTNDSIREDLGLPTSEEGTPIIGRPSLDRCRECGDQLPERGERCRTCGAPLTHSAAETELEPISPETAVDLSQFEVLGLDPLREVVLEEFEKLDQQVKSAFEATIQNHPEILVTDDVDEE